MNYIDWSVRFHAFVERLKGKGTDDENKVLEIFIELEKSWAEGGLVLDEKEVLDDFAKININLALATLEYFKIKTSQQLVAKQQTNELLSRFTLSKE